MTYTGGEYSVESLFQELKVQVRMENIHSYEEYNDLIDALVEEKKSYGFFTDEEDTEQIKNDLKIKWPEIKL